MWIIRRYDSADLPHVYRVHDLARVVELARGGVDPRAFRPMEEVADADEFFVSETLVACDGPNVIGFVSWKGDYITWLYVEPSYHRRGIGRRLLNEALRSIGPEAWTNTLGGNEAAVSLYRDAGMKVASSRSDEYEGNSFTSLRLALPTSRMHTSSVVGDANEKDE